jgi:hypothetical protein
VLCFEFNCTYQILCFFGKNKEEQGSYNAQENDGQAPSNDQSNKSFSHRIIDVLPDDFFGLWRLLNRDKMIDRSLEKGA